MTFICESCKQLRGLHATTKGLLCPPCRSTMGAEPDSRADFARERIMAEALAHAIIAGSRSPCAKSQRGVCVFTDRFGILASGYNTPPPGFGCDGSDGCREHCNKLCNHAELEALRAARSSRMYPISRGSCELIHVKVVGVSESPNVRTRFSAVPSGPPSCWQCSREILAEDIQIVWLLHEQADITYLQGYRADEFHRRTLAFCDLPVIKHEPSH